MHESTTHYNKPVLERFGTLRELTQVGCTAGGDGIWICRPPVVAGDEDSEDRS